MTNRGHCRIKPPLTTVIIDRMNKALNKTTIYHDKEMMIRTAIQKKARIVEVLINTVIL